MFIRLPSNLPKSSITIIDVRLFFLYDYVVLWYVYCLLSADRERALQMLAASGRIIPAKVQAKPAFNKQKKNQQKTQDESEKIIQETKKGLYSFTTASLILCTHRQASKLMSLRSDSHLEHSFDTNVSFHAIIAQTLAIEHYNSQTALFFVMIAPALLRK